MTPSDFSRRFGGRCPVCGEFLGDVPPVDPATNKFIRRPSLRLEVCRAVGAKLPWRLTVVGRASERFGSDTFAETAIEFTYLLCGNGHFFLDSTHWADTAEQFSVADWNMIAAVGSPVSGKSYLMTRALQQSLHHTTDYHDEDDEDDDKIVVEFYAGTPLEDLPMDNRKERYQDTLIEGTEMPPTQEDDLRPRDILLNQVHDEILDAIEEILDENVVDSAIDWDRWGTQPAQPIVVRTRATDGESKRNGWTCVVDLAGEFFTRGAESAGEVGMRDRANLRGYAGLVWVIDPLLEEQAFDPFASPVRVKRGQEEFDRLIRGSLRPVTVPTINDLNRARAVRRGTQRDIARRVTLLNNELMADIGGQVSLMVCVSKVDAFWTALKEGAKLEQLGEERQVLIGVARYLQQVARGVGERYFLDPDCEELLRHVDPAFVVDAKVRRKNMRGIASDLVDFYSDADNFWNLVERGRRASVPFPRLRSGSSQHGLLDGASIRIPSIGEHMNAALRVDRAGHHSGGAAHLLGLRDLVMSALGCGVMFGLGYGQEVSSLLDRDWVRLQFFLCSPLAAAPASRIDEEQGFDPLDDEEGFASSGDRSAALTQLLLRMLQGVF